MAYGPVPTGRLASKLPSNSISVEGWQESMCLGHFETLEPRSARHPIEPVPHPKGKVA
jgi:hypothetical protein